MKQIVLFSLIIFLCIRGYAQAPNAFSYQSIVRDSKGLLKVNSDIGFRISIVKDSVDGATVYSEVQLIKTNTNGLASMLIGKGTVVSGVFEMIDWKSGNYFLKSECDLNGGANYSLTGITQLLSVPYSFYSDVAGHSLDGLKAADIDKLIHDSVGFGEGGVLIAQSRGFKSDTSNFCWSNQYKQLLIGGSMKGTLLEGYSSGVQLIQNANVWPQMTIYSTGLSANSLPRYRGANIRGSLYNFENTLKSSVLVRLAGTGSVDNPDILHAGAQIEITSAEDWLSTSSPGNITLETVPVGQVTYKNYATFTYNGSFQLGFDHSNTQHNLVPSKSKLIIKASDPSDTLFALDVYKNDVTGKLFSIRNDGLISVNGRFTVQGKSTLESVEIKSTNWVYFGDENTDGSWRTGIVNGNLVNQKRESGSWVTKQTIQ